MPPLSPSPSPLAGPVDVDMVSRAIGVAMAAASQTKAAAGGPEDSSRETDKVNALARLEFRQQLPQLNDSDVDFDKHWMQFQSILDCHSFGRKGVRPMDVLLVYRKCLPIGSARLRIFNTMFARAMKRGRLPDQAREVMDEIRTKLQRDIRETFIQKQDR